MSERLDWDDVRDDLERLITDDVQDMVMVVTYPNSTAGYMHRIKNPQNKNTITDAMLEVMKQLNGGEQ